MRVSSLIKASPDFTCTTPRRQPAEAALLQAAKLDPRDPEACYALALFYAQGGLYVQALPWAEKVLALDLPMRKPEARQRVA